MSRTNYETIRAIEYVLQTVCKNAGVTALESIRSTTMDSTEYRFSLPRVAGSFHITGQMLDRMSVSRAAELYDLIACELEAAVRSTRGRALIDLLNMEWSPPREPYSTEKLNHEQMLQQMERAALRLMETVDRMRKEAA